MFIVHVDLSVEAASSAALSLVYHERFCPAIAQQAGFLEAKLLAASPPETQLFRLVIAFETELLQKRWVATALHREVWDDMQKNIARYSVMFFDTVQRVPPPGVRQ